MIDRLQQEVHEIRESVRVLKEKLRVAENALVRLLKAKQTLEHDISVSGARMRSQCYVVFRFCEVMTHFVRTLCC